MKGGWVYLLANRYRGAIYTGVAADLSARVDEAIDVLRLAKREAERCLWADKLNA